MSPIGKTLRNSIRMFPSLVNCCTINWFTEWPEEALSAVANEFLREIELADHEYKEVVKFCKGAHETAKMRSKQYLLEEKRYNYVTPTNYLELLMTYQVLLEKQRNSIMEMRQGYDKGIEKLEFTSQEVEKMQEQLSEKQPILKEMTIEAEGLLKIISTEKLEIVEPQKKLILEEERIANEHAEIAEAIRDECRKDLAKCEPMMKEAIAALDTIKQKDIDELKSFKKPPKVVMKVLHSVCIMCQVPPIRTPKPGNPREKEDNYWEAGKKFMGIKNFIEVLKKFDKNHIPDDVILKIRKIFLVDPEFIPKRAEKASYAAK